MFEDVFRKQKVKVSDEKTIETDHAWRMKPPRTVEMKNVDPLEIVEIAQECFFGVPITAENRARKAFEALKEEGSYRPRRYEFERK